MSCAVMRMRSPIRRTLPSTRKRTPSSSPSRCMSTALPLNLKVVLLHHQPGPDQLKQLLLGDQALAPLDQGEQNVQRPRPQRYRQPFREQLTGGRIELEPAEAVCGVHPRKSTPMAAVSEGFSHASAA